MERLTRPTVKVDETAAQYMAATGSIPADLRSMNDRLLDLVINGPTLNGVNKDVLRQMIRQLYAALMPYEDTGMEPEEIYENRLIIVTQKDPQKLRRLAELVNADSEGRLVVLPCKPGDTVYKICPISRFIEIGDRWDGRIVETDCQRCAYYACDCHNIGYNKEARNVVVERRMSKPEQIVRCMPYFGTIYFLTREEAERGLEGGTDNA